MKVTNTLYFIMHQAVLWIRDILVRLRILLFCQWLPRFQQKISIFSQSFLFFLLPELFKGRYIYISFHCWKVKKKPQNSRNQGFSYFFLLGDGRIWIWIRGTPKTYGSYRSGSTTLTLSCNFIASDLEQLSFWRFKKVLSYRYGTDFVYPWYIRFVSPFYRSVALCKLHVFSY